MGGRGSGGSNAVSLEDHLRRGTFRADRHLPSRSAAPSTPVTLGDRRRVLAGLGPAARRLVGRLLDAYEWDAASLHTLRLYGLSCNRLASLAAEDDDGRRRETRVNLLLLKALDLEGQ